MVLLFLSLFLFSKDVGFFVVGSTKTITDLCNYITKNDLDISFSYAGSLVNECRADRFENVDYIKFPLTVLLDRGADILYSNFNDLSFKKQLFSCAYQKYIGTASSKGFFIEGGDLNLDLLDNIPSSYTWIIGSVSKDVFQNLYDINGRNLLSFELVKSTDQIGKSSSTLFLLDERVYKNPLDIFLIFKSGEIRFFKVSDVLNNLPKSTDVFKRSSYFDEFKNEDINYIIYLGRIFNDLFEFKSDDTTNNLCDFFDFYPIDLDRLDEVYNEIRSLTYDLYFISSKKIPLFVYDDFLKNSVKTFFIEKTESFLKYQSKENTFVVSVDSNSVLFKIDFSTYISDLHIYADINKRAGQGLTNIIGRKEKISDTNAWEYSFILSNDKVKLYNSVARDYKLVKEFKIEREGYSIRFFIPRYYLRGDPLNWCYILIFWQNDESMGFFTKLSQNIFGCNE